MNRPIPGLDYIPVTFGSLEIGEAFTWDYLGSTGKEMTKISRHSYRTPEGKKYCTSVHSAVRRITWWEHDRQRGGY